jgi:hypothetical protein
VLSGRYSAASGAGSAAGEITVVLRAFNRCGRSGACCGLWASAAAAHSCKMLTGS